MLKYTLLLALLTTSFFIKAQLASIKGTIYATADLSRLTSAQLVLFKNQKYYQKTTVDRLGNYWFGGLEAGNYSLQVYNKGYCKVLLKAIVLKNADKKIIYDIGMMQLAKESNVPLQDFMQLYYEGDFKKELNQQSAPLQNYVEPLNIIADLYQGPTIAIRPKERAAKPTSHKATHFSESLQSLQKKGNIFPSIGF